MLVVGLCGRSGSGKSAFCELAKKDGFTVIDCDKIYHNLTSRRTRCLTEIEKNFGSEVVENDKLNRKKLASIVFADKEKLKKLNSIAHRHIINRVSRRIASIDAKNQNARVILDAPTLFESGAYILCNAIVLVSAPEEDCINRIVLRDNLTREQAVARLSNQLPVEYLAQRVNLHIINDATLEQFENDCKTALKIIKEKF